MKLRTEINLPPFPFQINHQDKIMLTGSCFTQNMGAQLGNNNFNTLENPYGITFNPLSIAKQIEEIITQRQYQKSDLDFIHNHFFSFHHHSVFTSATAEKLVIEINQHILEAYLFLKTAKVLFISMGTAWVWQHTAKNIFVNNCHKVPAKNFTYQLATADEITHEFSQVLKLLAEFNPNLQVVFTVSPVRHWRNGAINNSRSKAILISAANQLANSFLKVHYFPSYEIMIDDLRDYRFYEDDLLHPSPLAIDYIWKKFSDAFFTSKTVEANTAIAKIKAMNNHRHINSTNEDLEKFNTKLKKRKMALKEKFGLDY